MKKLLLLTSMILIVSCSEDRIETNAAQTSADAPIHLCTTADYGDSLVNQTARVSQKGSYWKTGQTVKIKFLNGDVFLQNKVKQFATKWLDYANLNFEWVPSNQSADIKIGFKWNGDESSWSYIGNQCGTVLQNQPSMNFGWFDSKTTDTEFSETVLHEFGHALGLKHEHQNLVSPIQWNVNAVYAEYAKYGWTKAKVDSNILKRFSTSEVDYTNFDKYSIMLYWFPPQLTLNNYVTPSNTQLSTEDKASIGQMYSYPGGKPVIPISSLPNKSTLNIGETLYAGQSIASPSKRYWLVMQTDGNLVNYDLINGGCKAIWNTGTTAYPGATVTMQGDGNFVMYKNGIALWNTATDKKYGATILLQDDGNLVIYLNGKALWSYKSGRLY